MFFKNKGELTVISFGIGCTLCVLSGVLELLKTLVTTSSVASNYIVITLTYLANTFKFMGVILIVSFLYYIIYCISKILDNVDKMQTQKEKQIS